MISPFFGSSFICRFIFQRVGERKGSYLHQTLNNLLIDLVCVRLVGMSSLSVFALQNLTPDITSGFLLFKD
jgi:hypothetical protein